MAGFRRDGHILALALNHLDMLDKRTRVHYPRMHVLCSLLSLVVRDLQYISISQYIDTLVEYRIMIRCSMNIEISDSAEQCM